MRVFVLWFLACATFAPLGRSQLAITDVRFFKTRESKPADEISGSYSRERLKRLYVRFTILGSQQTIADLEQHAFVSVKIDWRINGRVVDSVEVGITQDKWDIGEDDFRKQVQDNGVFTYRTFSYRTFIPIGSYQLTIRDGLGNVLAPSGFRGPGLYQPTLTITPL